MQLKSLHMNNQMHHEFSLHCLSGMQLSLPHRDSEHKLTSVLSKTIKSRYNLINLCTPFLHHSQSFHINYLSICPFLHPHNSALLLLQFCHLSEGTSGEEDHKDDEEDDEDEEDLNHEPAVGRDRLEVLEDLRVGRLHVQLRVLHVSINPDRTEDKDQPCIYNYYFFNMIMINFCVGYLLALFITQINKHTNKQTVGTWAYR